MSTSIVSTGSVEVGQSATVRPTGVGGAATAGASPRQARTSSADASDDASDVDAAAGSGTLHDVLTGAIGELWRDRDLRGARCLADDEPSTSYRDSQPLGTPSDGYWYLVRAQNTCGTGPVGPGSRELPPTDCD